MSDEEDFEEEFTNLLLPEISVITIVLEEGKLPKVDLGDVTPPIAAAIMRRICESLDEFIAYPEITYNNEMLFDPGQYWDAYSDGDDED